VINTAYQPYTSRTKFLKIFEQPTYTIAAIIILCSFSSLLSKWWLHNDGLVHFAVSDPSSVNTYDLEFSYLSEALKNAWVKRKQVRTGNKLTVADLFAAIFFFPCFQ
jgi:hypothetical protein